MTGQCSLNFLHRFLTFLATQEQVFSLFFHRKELLSWQLLFGVGAGAVGAGTGAVGVGTGAVGVGTGAVGVGTGAVGVGAGGVGADPGTGVQKGVLTFFPKSDCASTSVTPSTTNE